MGLSTNEEWYFFWTLIHFAVNHLIQTQLQVGICMWVWMAEFQTSKQSSLFFVEKFQGTKNAKAKKLNFLKKKPNVYAAPAQNWNS